MASFIFKTNPILYLAEKDKLVYTNEIDFLKRSEYCYVFGNLQVIYIIILNQLFL